MTDAEYRRQVKRLTDRLAYWTRAFNIFQGWRIEHRMEREEIPHPRDDHMTVVAYTITQWEYLTATMVWNIPCVSERDDDALDWDILHEFCHVFVAEIVNDEQSPAQQAAEERVCSTLASILLSVRNQALPREKPKRLRKATRKVSLVSVA